jgi:hypothetical protein
VSKALEERYGIPLRLIVIDTMLAAFDIRDWNDPAEARRVANILSRIAVETGSVVLGIQHRGKDVSWGAAGSYALTAAADFRLSVFADTDSKGGRLGGLRDGPTDWSCEFEVKGVQDWRR